MCVLWLKKTKMEKVEILKKVTVTRMLTRQQGENPWMVSRRTKRIILEKEVPIIAPKSMPSINSRFCAFYWLVKAHKPAKIEWEN